MARVELPASRLKARRRKRRLLIILSCFILLCVALGGVVVLSWTSFVRIQAIHIEGASSVSTSAVEEQAKTLLAGTYWYIFPRDNIFLYPKNALRAALLVRFPAFASATVSAENFQTLKISAVERMPAALWCGEGTEPSAICMSLDQTGAAYQLAADFSGDVYTRYVGALPEGPLPRQFLTPEKFRSLAAFVSEFSSKVASTSIRFVAIDGDDTRITLANGFTLIFSLKDDGADVLSRFTLALQADPFTAHALSDFEYLDLRFGDKLYYKLK